MTLLMYMFIAWMLITFYMDTIILLNKWTSICHDFIGPLNKGYIQ